MTSKQSLTNIALKRIRSLANGNGIDPKTIQLVENKEEIYTLSGFLQLTSRCSHRSRDKFGRIKTKNGKLLPSFEALNQEIAKIERNAQEGSEWINKAIKKLEKTAGHGWGHKDSHLSWSNKETILIATENCPACKGSAQHPCNDCQGIGTTHCHYCQGMGQELCQYCQGSGHDLADHSKQCHICHGTRYQTCRMCHGTKRLSCPVCGGKGNTKCTSCKGTGALSREIRIKLGADISFKLKSTNGIPSGLLRSISRIGEENIHKGFADIKMLPQDKDAKNITERSRINLEAKVPYADLKIRFGNKASLISCFGKKARLTGVPAFLDQSLKTQREYLLNASKGKTKIETALKARVMKDALKLSLSGKTHPNNLRMIYPVGLTGNTAKEIMKHMGLALKKETMKVRTISASLCTIMSVSIFASIFMTSFYKETHTQYKASAMIAGEIALPAITLLITWFTLHSFAKNILKHRFPSATIKTSPNIGTRGYIAMAIIIFSYIAMISYAKMNIG